MYDYKCKLIQDIIKNVLLITGFIACAIWLSQFLVAYEKEPIIEQCTITGYTERSNAFDTDYYVKFTIDGYNGEGQCQSTKVYYDSKIGDVYYIKVIPQCNFKDEIIKYSYEFLDKIDEKVIDNA